MQYLGLIILGLAGLVIEVTLLPAFKLAGVRADLLIVIISIFALLKGKTHGATLGFIYGLLEDIYLAQYVGLNAVSKMFTGYLIGLSKNWLNERNWLVPGLLAFMATIIQAFPMMILGQIIGLNYPWRSGLVSIVMPMALYNASLAVIGYSFYQGGVAWANRRKKIGSQN